MIYAINKFEEYKIDINMYSKLVHELGTWK